MKQATPFLQRAFERGYTAGWQLVTLADSLTVSHFNPYDESDARDQYSKGFVSGVDHARAWIESGACEGIAFDSVAAFARGVN